MNAAASKASGTVLAWKERGLVPDTVIRAGIRQLLRQRLRDVHADDPAVAADEQQRFVDAMDRAPIALVPERANEQHYEVPAAFFGEVLGAHAKYSCCYWEPRDDSLEDAEQRALEISCQRAGIRDGMTVLDLGCGWGSLSLWIAERYPACRVTAVSNSVPQRRHIESLATKRSLDNISVLTADMNDFRAEARYDRVVSVEMFEHMRNYRKLFGRIAQWLQPDGRFFMHIFCHRQCAYAFEDQGPADWMGRHFFSGGMMPSDDLPLHFQEDLVLDARYRWSGRHYERTANAWLERMDGRRDRIVPILERTYGASEAERWFQRWRIFFMACAELFAHAAGREWFVAHYLFRRRDDAKSAEQNR